MFNYLNDLAFVETVLERGHIPFVIRGDVKCDSVFEFTPTVGIRVFPPTSTLKVFKTGGEENETIFVEELVNEAVFSGEIELPEKTEKGISMALWALERWADFLCLALGNPKLKVEIQLPLRAVITTRHELTLGMLNRWGQFIYAHSKLPPNERLRVAKALWWYRKACSTAYHSIFDSYTAYWNCLEILCGVTGNRTRKGAEVDRQIQDYLQEKEKSGGNIRAKDVINCYNKFINYSIRQQMQDALNMRLKNDAQASRWIFHCFEIKPNADRLYQIRNDINHGNIVENAQLHHERVYLRGMLLSAMVMELLCFQLGRKISFGYEDIDTLWNKISEVSSLYKK